MFGCVGTWTTRAYLFVEPERTDTLSNPFSLIYSACYLIGTLFFLSCFCWYYVVEI